MSERTETTDGRLILREQLVAALGATIRALQARVAELEAESQASHDAGYGVGYRNGRHDQEHGEPDDPVAADSWEIWRGEQAMIRDLRARVAECIPCGGTGSTSPESAYPEASPCPGCGGTGTDADIPGADLDVALRMPRGPTERRSGTLRMGSDEE